MVMCSFLYPPKKLQLVQGLVSKIKVVLNICGSDLLGFFNPTVANKWKELPYIGQLLLLLFFR